MAQIFAEYFKQHDLTDWKTDSQMVLKELSTLAMENHCIVNILPEVNL